MKVVSLYFIQINKGPIKIGRAESVTRRLKTIQIYTPYEVELLKTIVNIPIRIEKLIHKKFHHIHIRGEWFHNKPELINWIECLSSREDLLAEFPPEKTKVSKVNLHSMASIPTDECIFNDYISEQNGYPYRMQEGIKVYECKRILEEKLGRPLREGYSALHKCLNKTCLNPNHIVEGSYSDNSAQRILAGKQPRGEANFLAKLTTPQVTSILTLSDKGESSADISRFLGIHPSQVSRIVNRKTWTHVYDDYEKFKQENKKHNDYD